MSEKNICPKHIAIIMDGNGRWAKNKGEERVTGHKSGVDSLKSVVRAAGDLDVEYLTIYAFSSENWNRPQQEVDALMQLFTVTLSAEIDSLTENGVKLHFLGNIAGLPVELQQMIDQVNQITPDHIKLNLVIAINYGAREEITQAVRDIAQKVADNDLAVSDITPEMISQNMLLPQIPDPDLLIRTSGELRISNFLLWQLSYSELYFTSTYWPDFDAQELNLAIEEYQKRHRRYGAL
ncbi:MAG: isoprenyl transferase [Rikenellaceae bacterium]